MRTIFVSVVVFLVYSVEFTWDMVPFHAQNV